MATAKRARKPSAEKSAVASNLLEALKFISVAQHTDGTPMQSHCRISDGTVVGFDGGLTVGHYIEETLNVCPHTATLISALSKCKETISITELDSGKLSIKSGKFRALVPCVDFRDIPAIQPDSPVAAITDTLKVALAACVPLTQDNGTEPFTCAVLLQAGTAVATNRHVVIEAWHGLDLPPGILIPKASVSAICKTDKHLKAFGFSSNSATFFFEDDSFIKTQLYINNFPQYQKLLDIESNAFPLPAGFYEAVETIAPFIEKEKTTVYFIDGKISSHYNTELGASFEVEGLKNGLAFNVNYLKLIRQHTHMVQFDANDRGMALFFGDNVRGAIMKVTNGED